MYFWSAGSGHLTHSMLSALDVTSFKPQHIIALKDCDIGISLLLAKRKQGIKRGLIPEPQVNIKSRIEKWQSKTKILLRKSLQQELL